MKQMIAALFRTLANMLAPIEPSAFIPKTPEEKAARAETHAIYRQLREQTRKA